MCTTFFKINVRMKCILYLLGMIAMQKKGNIKVILDLFSFNYVWECVLPVLCECTTYMSLTHRSQKTVYNNFKLQLWMVMNHNVDSGNQTQVTHENNKCPSPQSDFSSPRSGLKLWKFFEKFGLEQKF